MPQGAIGATKWVKSAVGLLLRTLLVTGANLCAAEAMTLCVTGASPTAQTESQMTQSSTQ